MTAFAPLVCIGRIAEADPVPTPSVDLVDSTRGSCGDKGKVVGGFCKCVVHSVEAAPDVGPSKIAQQPLTDSIALQRGQAGIFRYEFTSIGEQEPPDLEFARLTSQAVKAQVELLGKNHGGAIVVAVGRIIVRPQSERTLRRGIGSRRREAD